MPIKSKPIMEMFDTAVSVFGAPGRYLQGRGAIRLTGDCAATLGRPAALVVDATVHDQIAGPVERSCQAAGVDLTVLSFAGEIDSSTARDLGMQIDDRSHTVIAAGGGRTIDAGKALAERLGGGLITLPTVASNDAPTSKNFVLYDDQHRLLEVRHLMRNPDFAIVDTEILAQAPRILFRAGLGDAIAKKFEAEACAASRGETMFGAAPTRVACEIARYCYRTLIRHGAGGWAAAGTGEVTEDFDASVEAMILMAGLGFENGGLSLPHALTRGIPLLPGGRDIPHGLQVAWALLVHLDVLGEEPPVELLALYRMVGLPLSLADVGLTWPGDAELGALAEATLGARHARNLPFPLDADTLVAAIQRVETKAGPRSLAA